MGRRQRQIKRNSGRLRDERGDVLSEASGASGKGVVSHVYIRIDGQATIQSYIQVLSDLPPGLPVPFRPGILLSGMQVWKENRD